MLQKNIKKILLSVLCAILFSFVLSGALFGKGTGLNAVPCSDEESDDEYYAPDEYDTEEGDYDQEYDEAPDYQEIPDMEGVGPDDDDTYDEE